MTENKNSISKQKCWFNLPKYNGNTIKTSIRRIKYDSKIRVQNMVQGAEKGLSK